MSGMTGLDTNACRGLFQRVFALTVFPPIGVGAYVLARRVTAAPSALGTLHTKKPAASPVGSAS